MAGRGGPQCHGPRCHSATVHGATDHGATAPRHHGPLVSLPSETPAGTGTHLSEHWSVWLPSFPEVVKWHACLQEGPEREGGKESSQVLRQLVTVIPQSSPHPEPHPPQQSTQSEGRLHDLRGRGLEAAPGFIKQSDRCRPHPNWRPRMVQSQVWGPQRLISQRKEGVRLDLPPPSPFSLRAESKWDH